MGTCVCMWLLIEVTGGIVKHQPNAAKLIRLVFTSLYQFILVFTIDAELLKIEDCTNPTLHVLTAIRVINEVMESDLYN